MRSKGMINFIRQVFSEWSEDKAPRLAAALAYYTIFSIPPLLLAIIGFAGWFFGRAAVQSAIMDQIALLLNPDTAAAIGRLLESAGSQQQRGAAAVVGILVLLVGASGVFGQLQDALNTIWEVRPKPGQGLEIFIKKRLFSFVIVLGLGFLLLVSMVLSTALSVLSGFIQDRLPGSGLVFQLVNFLLPFLVIALLFALMFKFMPDAETQWRDVWLGAAVTSLLFNLGKTLIGLYLANSNPASAFGAAASVVLVLVWVYYTAQILFLGAEFTVVYANQYGAGIVPDEHAERVGDAERARQGIPRKDPGQGTAWIESLRQQRAQPSPDAFAPIQSMERILSRPARRQGAEKSFFTVAALGVGLFGMIVGLLLGKKTGSGV